MRLSLILLICMLFSLPVRANDLNLQRFMELPILHEGRIKPITSFARANLKQLSGHERGAQEWFIETLFNPALSEKTPVLRIKNPDVLNFLELDRRKSGLYAHHEISAALFAHQESIVSILKLPEEQWTYAQADVIMLQRNAVLLGDLLSSLNLFLPLSIELPEDIEEPFKAYSGQVLSYVDTLKFSKLLEARVKDIVAAKGEDVQNYTEAEQTLAYLSFATARLRATGVRSAVFKTVPLKGGEWVSPWVLVSEGLSGPDTQELMSQWKALAHAYHADDNEAWNAALDGIEAETLKLGGEQIRSGALIAENIYNSLQPLYISMGFYVLALILLIGEVVSKRLHFPRIAMGALNIGAIFHIFGMGLRIYILARPPVSTLYESILFVGLIVVLYGLITFMRDPRSFWLYMAAGLGIVLHLIGFSHESDGDNMMMLSAVLNTNFWLATHVICITAAYGFCVICAALSHYALVRDIVIEKLEKPSKALYTRIQTLALISLLLATVGTVLGGIWADQSWGRFWGWDPKENGAMLICLWLIWLIHGRISGQMNRLHVTLGLAYLNVIVALSWFGVNLLSVGLHSYGFTDSMAFSLGSFIAAESLFILWVCFVLMRRKSAHV